MVKFQASSVGKRILNGLILRLSVSSKGSSPSVGIEPAQLGHGNGNVVGPTCVVLEVVGVLGPRRKAAV